MAEFLRVFDDEYTRVPGDPLPEDPDYDYLWGDRLSQARRQMESENLNQLPYCKLQGLRFLAVLNGEIRETPLPAEQMSAEALEDYDREAEAWINDTAPWDIEDRRRLMMEKDRIGRFEMEKPILPREVYFTAPSPRQKHLDERFHKTTAAIDLLKRLMHRQAEQGNVHLIVATREDAPDLEMQDWISRKEVHFYEALMDWILASAPGDYYKRVPVSSSFDLTEAPVTEDYFMAIKVMVYQLFRDDDKLREAAYACVPSQMRHRKHRAENLEGLFQKYKEHHDIKDKLDLSTLLNGNRKAYKPLDQALEACKYVLFQISLVLLVGCKKLGPENETRYDQATLSFKAKILEALKAAGLVNSPITKQISQFEAGDTIDSEAKVPYRSVPDKKQCEPEVISLFNATSRWVMAGVRPNQILARGIGELKDLEMKLSIAEIIGLPTDAIHMEARKVHEQLNNALGVLCRRHEIEERRLDRDNERSDLIIRRMAERANRSHQVNGITRMAVAGSIYDMAAEQAIRSRSQAPYWMQAVILRRTGLQSAACSPLQGLHVIQRRFSEWFPVRVSPQPDEMHRGEYLLQVMTELLHGNTEVDGCFNNRSPLDHSISQHAKQRHSWFRNQLVRWEIDYFTFHDAIFTPSYEDGTYSGGRLQSGLYEQKTREENHDFERRKWLQLEQVFERFKGPFKAIYDNYMHEIVRLEESRANNRHSRMGGFKPAPRSRAVLPKTELQKHPDLVGSDEALELYFYIAHNKVLNPKFQAFVCQSLEEMLGEIPSYGNIQTW